MTYARGMRSPGVGILRALRVTVLASAVVGITIGAHVFGGGQTPDVVPGVILTGLTAVACHLILARKTSFLGLLAILGLGQFGLHHAFEFCAELSSTGLNSSAQMHAHHESSDATMLLMHAVATVVVAVLLNWGERSIWRLWSWLSLRWLPQACRIDLASRPAPVQVSCTLPAPAPGVDAVMGRAPPVLI